MSLRFALTGSTGMIGSTVYEWLTQRGHTVTRLVRPSSIKKPCENDIVWDPHQKTLDLNRLEGYDAVIHLAGANISNHRWTPEYKKVILESRVDGTSFLAQSLCKLKHPPKHFFCASAVGYYGCHLTQNVFDETGLSGPGFLAQVTRQWELAAQPAQDAGIKVIPMRFGVVLDTRGGALAKMLPPFYLGLGGPIGSGQQMISWIALWEIPQIIYFLATQKAVKGPVNFTAPQPVSSREFAQILGKVIHRPAVLPLPEFVVSALFGEMGQELLLKGANVVPRRLLDTGYNFAYPDLRSALISILK